MPEHSSELLRLVICDDHLLILEGLKALLARHDHFVVAGEATSDETVREMMECLLPDVALVVLSGASRIETIRQIRREHPSVAVIAIARHDDLPPALEIYRAGAAAYLGTGLTLEDLLTAIHAVSSGSVVLSSDMAGDMIRAFMSESGGADTAAQSTPAIAGLSPREIEVLQLVTQGKSNKEIARELSISVRTAQNHLANIFRKLEINDRISAALYAIDKGIGASNLTVISRRA